MEGKNALGYQERVARIVWAAHILSYLAKKRSHADLLEPDDVEEEEDLEDAEIDARSERVAILQGTRESICSKFLDCVAQLLSPSKGWSSVTATGLREEEDFVEIDVARNDCFGTTESDRSGEHVVDLGKDEADYCAELKGYLSAEIRSGTFELTAIAYTSRRVDHWVKQLRSLLGSVPDRGQPSQLALEAWRNLIQLIRQKDVETADIRERIVQHAYECTMSEDIHGHIEVTLEAKIGTRLWHILRFLARPIADSRMLWYIAKRQPHFRDVRFSLLSAAPKTNISPEYQIDICHAWARLGSGPPSALESRMLANFGEQFQHDCAKSYSLHAEIQLFLHYEHHPSLLPTFQYFGGSKKACLLCQGFLRSLSRPIMTRGRHGICYPAWGAPVSSSIQVKSTLGALEGMLISRITTFLSNPVQAYKLHSITPVLQSTLVSDLSDSTNQDLARREEKAQSARNKERAQREERLILEGAALTSEPLNNAHAEFHPHDSCVMCNKHFAKPCKRCQSCYYCSTECQNSDWPSHKLLCKSFSTQDMRPSLSHKRAILFPESSTKPLMIWIPCESLWEDGEGSYEKLNLHPYLGPGDPPVGTTQIDYNPIRDRGLGTGLGQWAPRQSGYPISLKFRDAFLEDGSTINKSILTSVGMSGTVPHQWCGPIVAVQATPFETYEDITLADFRHIIDYVRSYLTTETPESVLYPGPRVSSSIRGVKICCYGERVLHYSDLYVSVDVPKAHAIRLSYNKAEISPISKVLGTPIKLWKYPDIDTWIDPPGWSENMTADSNQNAAFLMTEIDLNNPDWGWVPPYWSTDLGNVLAVRADYEDLAADDVVMMCNFARWKLRPMFETALSDGSQSFALQAKQVLDSITWENMVKYRDAPNEE